MFIKWISLDLLRNFGPTRHWQCSFVAFLLMLRNNKKYDKPKIECDTPNKLVSSKDKNRMQSYVLGYISVGISEFVSVTDYHYQGEESLGRQEETGKLLQQLQHYNCC